MLCVYMNGKVSVVFNRYCLLKMKDYSRLCHTKGSDLHRKCVSIEEVVQDGHAVTTHH